MHSHILFTQPFQIPIESRIGDVHAVCIQNFGLAGSAECGNGEGHGDAVILLAVDHSTVQRLAVSVTSAPIAVKFSTMTAMRFDSFTFSSAASRMTVVPSA